MFRPRQTAQTLHGLRFPGESAEYRRARDELLQAEIELRRQTERVAAQRRELPLGGVVPTDYVFDEWDDAAGAPREVRLSELFDGRDTLLLYSFMIVPPEQELPFVGPCPSCTSIIDGIDGALPHITQRLAFATADRDHREEADAEGQRHRLERVGPPDQSRPRSLECCHSALSSVRRLTPARQARRRQTSRYASQKLTGYVARALTPSDWSARTSRIG